MIFRWLAKRAIRKALVKDAVERFWATHKGVIPKYEVGSGGKIEVYPKIFYRFDPNTGLPDGPWHVTHAYLRWGPRYNDQAYYCAGCRKIVDGIVDIMHDHKACTPPNEQLFNERVIDPNDIGHYDGRHEVPPAARRHGE